MQVDSVKNYLISSSVNEPYFLFISDGQYASAKGELSVLGLDFVQTSEFCSSADKMPDLDRLLNYIKVQAADINANEKKFVITGLGEFLALRGRDEAKRTLSRLKDFNFGGAKVVLLLRGLALLIDELRKDLRFDSRRFSVVDKAECDLSFTLAAPAVGLSALSGFQAMLAELDKGRCGSIVVNTAVNLDKAIFTIHKISSAYDGIKLLIKEFPLESSCGSDDRWAELLVELNKNNNDLDKIFEKYGLGNNFDTISSILNGNSYYNWLCFIYLKINRDTLHNGYLAFVINKTIRFEDLIVNILNLIIDIKHDDNRFMSFYRERKILIEKLPEYYIADFVSNNRKVALESIYNLTDRTIVEREEIISWISKNGIIPMHHIDYIYPDLSSYIKKYVFKCPELANLLTDYFDAYKRQKLLNRLEPEFLEKVDELALSRNFNRLPTRNEIMDSVDKSDTFLYWLDALGVEYLGLIEALAQKCNLSIRVSIARAELPTTTAINRDFFDAWQGRKEKNNKLDDTKHSDAVSCNFTNHELPVHLAKELEVITEMIDKAALELVQRHCKRFLIASDHGASRLAVLQRKEEKYDTDTTGERSGRCCKLFQPYDLPFAAEANGYLVLANYGRFKGSRAANVEVHGGSSLEEVVVPIIELSLKDGSITVTLVDETVTVDFRTGTEIKLFFNSPVQDVFVVLNRNKYFASQIDENRYSVKLPDTKRAGEYPAEVYANDNLISKIMIKAQGKSGKINDAFDGLF